MAKSLKTLSVQGTTTLTVQETAPPVNYLHAFVFMTVSFSIQHGCITAVIGLSTSDFPDHIASAANAMLYAVYGVSAVLLTVPFLAYLGEKWTMCLASGLFTAYVIAFGIVSSVQLPEKAKYIILLTGSFIAGIGAGGIWTSQGTYFGRTAKLHAEATGQKREDVNSFFAAIFTSIFLFFAMLMNLVSTVVQHMYGRKGRPFVFIFYSVVAVVSVIGLCFVHDLPRPKPESPGEKDAPESALWLAFKKLREIKVVCTDPKLWLIGPFCWIGGICLPFLASYLNGELAKQSLGAKNIGVLISIPPAYAALVAVPYSYLSRKFGKCAFLLSSSAAYMAVGFLGLLVPQKLQEHPWIAFVGLQLLFGHVRAVFYAINNAVFADFFPKAQAGAFAMLNVYSSVSTSSGYLVFALGHNTKHVGKLFGVIMIAFCALSFITTPLAFYVHNRNNITTIKRESRSDSLRLLDQYSLEYTKGASKSLYPPQNREEARSIAILSGVKA